MRRTYRAGALGMIVVLAACGGGDQSADAGAAGDTAMVDTAAQSAAPAGQLSDPEIVAVLATSDTAEIQPSQLANQKGENAQVKQFAQMMLNDHGMLSDSMRALAQASNLAPAPNAMTQQMQTQLQSTMQSLQGLSGAAFDSAYVQWMVQSHQTTLDAIDQQLLTSAQNPQLRAAIEQKVRPTVQTHLQQIQQIQSGLGGSR